MPRSHSVVLNLPGQAIGDLVAGILRSFGFSASEQAAARITAKSTFNNSFYRNLRRLVFPAVQRRLPVRTGKLKRSFRMIRKGDNAIFTHVFYGGQKIVRPRPRQTVRGVIVEELIRRADPVVGRAIQDALDAAS